jgi:molybdate transport system ATP-binding protein
MSLQLSARVDRRGVDIDFEVATGETVALLGPNGTGKSTVLSVIAGLLTPDSGTVVLDGHCLTAAAPGASRVAVPPHARRTALLGQEPLLFPHLSALENVAFGPRSRGVRRAEARRTAQGWLDEVGVGELAARRPDELSGGQAQRVAVARALAAEPSLLLLDEPMAALDVAVLPALRQTLRRVLTDRTVIVVTHDPLDALLLADRVVVLDAGRVIESGPSSEVLKRPRSAFAARLAGLNLVTGTWRGDHVETTGGDRVAGLVQAEAIAAGTPVVAAFRPHSVSVFHDPVHGSPRNSFQGRISELEPHAELLRVRAGDLAADITVQAAADLQLEPGQFVTLTVKATEVAVYPL